MEAARIAALAGHRVVLAEATPSLGGLPNLYKTAPRMGTIPDIIGWLEQEVYRLGVEVRLSTWLDADDIVAEAADSVILAVGAELEPPAQQVLFPAEPVVVTDGGRILSPIDLFAARGVDRGRSAVVVDEPGHYEAVACAEYLLEQGIAVTFVTRHKMFVPGVDATLRTQATLERFHARGDFTLRVGSRVVEVRAGQVDIAPAYGKTIETFAADTVVWVPIRPGQPDLIGELAARGIPAVAVGDVIAGRNLQTAIREGHLAARSL
jgi:NADPH-dependent 2,4-dienoyl-CoA reductase/sulfur reductase-like enzyme